MAHPFNVQQSFADIQARASTIENINNSLHIIYMTFDNKWNPSNRNLLQYPPLVSSIKCNYPSTYVDNSEYEITIHSISKVKGIILAKELTYNILTTSTITSNERYSSIDMKSLVKQWKIGFESATQNSKNSHLRWYKTCTTSYTDVQKRYFTWIQCTPAKYICML